jgi:acyl carrier protein
MDTNSVVLSEGAAARAASDIECWLVERFAQLANVEPSEIDSDRPFSDYALDSSVAVTVTAEFSRWLGSELAITLFWEYPTIRSLAAGLGCGSEKSC